MYKWKNREREKISVAETEERVALTAKSAKSIQGCMNTSRANKDKEVISSLCSVHARPHLEYFVQFQAHQFMENIAKLEEVREGSSWWWKAGALVL